MNAPNIKSATITARVISRLMRKAGFTMADTSNPAALTEGFYVSRVGCSNMVSIGYHHTEVYGPERAKVQVKRREERKKLDAWLKERGYKREEGTGWIKCGEGRLMAVTHNKLKKIVRLRELATQLGLPGVIENRHYTGKILLVISLGDNCSEAEAKLRRLAQEFNRRGRNMKTHHYYEVRFILYHYNSGDGRNGHYPHQESFLNLNEAHSFRDRLEGQLANKESTSEFASRYCWDGHLVSVEGVYEIMELLLP